MDTVSRFSDRATDYVRYRPGYPPAIVPAIVDGLGPYERLLVADVGAGTGISARLFAAAGLRVIAIEPGEAMRRAATPDPKVTWMAAKADQIALAPDTVDVVVCAQAFHWFSTPAAVDEFARILRPDGRLGIVWNRRSRSDPFTTGYRDAILAVSGESDVERMAFDPGVVDRTARFTALERHTFPNQQRLDYDGLVGRARSASYVPKSGPDGDRLIALLRALYERYADATGTVTLIYETEVYSANKI